MTPREHDQLILSDPDLASPLHLSLDTNVTNFFFSFFK